MIVENTNQLNDYKLLILECLPWDNICISTF